MVLNFIDFLKITGQGKLNMILKREDENYKNNLISEVEYSDYEFVSYDK